MNSTYAQKSSTVQKVADAKAASVLDSSSQGESLQRKADMANNAIQRAEAPRPNNTGMPDNLKSGIESLSGFSMDDVRVHYNSSKPATVQALAYTQGTDIHVAPGQEKCLPHEAWHVAQQMAGRVSPTTNINGMPVNDNAALEHEADVMGEKAVTQRKENVEIKSQNVHGGPLQLKPGEKNDMVCAADVLYRDKSGVNHHVKGIGYNNPDDASGVLKVFKDHGLTNLGAGNYQRDKKDPNPGQCAEPHAFADALKKIPTTINPDNIVDVFISESVIRKLGPQTQKIKEGGEIKEKIIRKAIENVSSGRVANSIRTYSRCRTCSQWIQDDGRVKPYYLQRGADEPAPVLEGAFSNEQSRELEKYERYNEVDKKIVVGKHGFFKVDFFDLKEAEKLNVNIPGWLINDSYAQGINAQTSLRTVIRKQLLKNRIAEMMESDFEETDVEKLGVYEKAYYYLCHRRLKDGPKFLSEKIDSSIKWSSISKKDAISYKLMFLQNFDIFKSLDEISENVKKSRWENDAEKIKDEKKLTITQVKDILKRNYLSENELDYLRKKTSVEIKEDDAMLAME